MIEALPLVAWPSWPSLNILIYHRVLRAPDPLFPGEIDAVRFEQQMQYIGRNFSVIPLHEGVHGLKEDRLPRRACCITFDDGYADNLTVALPILEKYELPATVFVATAYVDGGCMFNDAVIDIVARTKCAVLDLQRFGLECYELDTREARKAAISKILWKKRFLPPIERNEFVTELSDAAGIGAVPTDLMLTRGQLVELSRRGVEIGGHTVNHPILSSIDAATARQEIALGKEILEDWIGRPVRCFAYPNGMPGRDFGTEHVAMVREIGFELAVTTARGIASRRSDPFQIPRFMPWGDSMFKLGARMARAAWTAAV